MATYHAPASKRQIDRLKKLSKKKFRSETNLFLAEGKRTVEQLIQQRVVGLEEIYCTESYLSVYDQISVEVPLFLISEKDLKAVSDTEEPPGILAVARQMPFTALEHWKSSAGNLLAFDRIQDPGNLGTLIRTACWFGLHGILLGKGTTEIWSPKVVRSTAGATAVLPACQGDMMQMLEQLTDWGWRPVLLDGNDGSSDIMNWEPGSRNILVIGNEAQGIAPQLAARYPRMRIDGADQNAAESLNASVAGAIAMQVLFSKSRLMRY